jgi:hypothetical protein
MKTRYFAYNSSYYATIYKILFIYIIKILLQTLIT